MLSPLRVPNTPRDWRLVRRALGALAVVAAPMGTLGAVFYASAPCACIALDDANVDITRLQMAKLEQALGRFQADNDGTLPTTQEGLAPVAGFVHGGEVPTDAWGQPFAYFSPGVHSDQAYELISFGSDGTPGGSGDSADLASWELQP